MAPNAAHGWERFFDGTGAGTQRRGVDGELFLLVAFFAMLPRSHPVLVRPVFRPMQKQPGLSAAAGPFAKVQLPQLGVEGKFRCVL